MLSSFLFNYYMKLIRWGHVIDLDYSMKLLRWGHVIDLDYFMKLLRWGHVIEKDLLALTSPAQFMHTLYT